MPEMKKEHDWTPDRIRALRKRMGLNQTDFGKEIYFADDNVAQRTVSGLERGEMSLGGAAVRTLMRLEQKHPPEDE